MVFMLCTVGVQDTQQDLLGDSEQQGAINLLFGQFQNLSNIAWSRHVTNLGPLSI